VASALLLFMVAAPSAGAVTSYTCKRFDINNCPQSTSSTDVVVFVNDYQPGSNVDHTAWAVVEVTSFHVTNPQLLWTFNLANYTAYPGYAFKWFNHPPCRPSLPDLPALSAGEGGGSWCNYEKYTPC
jgi:hypothetical protein